MPLKELLQTNFHVYTSHDNNNDMISFSFNTLEDPDDDGDGILDEDEDQDGDGLTNAGTFEIIYTQTFYYK